MTVAPYCRALSLALAMIVTASLALASVAAAAPTLGLEVSRAPTTVKRNDEFVGYAVKLKNVGSTATSAPTNVSIALPSGLRLGGGSGGTSPNNWICHPSAQTCTNSATVLPGAEFPQLALEVWIYPEAAPETVVAAFTTFGGGAAADATAQDAFAFGAAESFGFVANSFTAEAKDELGGINSIAGAHPFKATTSFALPTHSSPAGTAYLVPVEDMRDLVVDLPPGFIANPQADGGNQCTTARVKEGLTTCPESTVVGSVKLEYGQGQTSAHNSGEFALFEVRPEKGHPAEFAFKFESNLFVIQPQIRSDGDYGITAVSPLAQQEFELFAGAVTLCKYGGFLSVTAAQAIFKGCKKAADPGAYKAPFITNSTSCPGAEPVTRGYLDSWQHPGAQLSNGLPDLHDPAWKTEETKSPAITACDQVEFTPAIASTPAAPDGMPQARGDAPSGLDFDLHIPQNGLEEPGKIAQSHLEDSTVKLPAGLAVNPSSASGLEACSPSRIGLTTAVGLAAIHFDEAEPACPDGSKLGTAEVVTPLLEKPLKGAVYLARQRENPFGSLLAFYIAIDDPDTGIVVKLAGKVVPDKQTGQLVATVDDNPQVPFEDLRLHFFAGPRAALRTPAVCGEYSTSGEFTPWSAPQTAKTPSSTFNIAQSCARSTAAEPNAPSFEAGAVTPEAGAYSPFLLRLSRNDGSQELHALDVTLPEGLSAKLAGIPQCSDAQIAQARRRGGLGEGDIERARPSCPPASEVGTVSVGAGAGEDPFYAQGRVYLAGPYKGAPLSLVVITPAVAGPFDLGTVVVRSAAFVNPLTARVTVKSDEIPTMLEGIPLDVRSIAIKIDRGNFVLNPTNCEEQLVNGTAFGSASNAELSDHFHVGDCAALKFKPSLKLQLHGGTKRGSYQRLTATVTYPRKGLYANVARAAVTLPHSEFLAQEHIRTVCTRVQFAAHECPKASIYGHAKAVTPLLEQPLTGPVYLRSSDNPLPDLVAALKGPESMPIEVELDGRTDSKHGGIRNTFEMVPDVPVSTFTLSLQGGKKSLIVNSRDLCKGLKQRATVRLDAQNGMRHDFRPVLGNDCGKAAKRHRARRLLRSSAFAWAW
jgi:hypothetical protein